MPSAPVNTHQQFTSGDDCKAADGRALTWTSSSWPSDLPGATYSLVIGHDQYNLYGNLPLTWTGTLLVEVNGVPVTGASIAAGTEVTVSIDVTAAQTSLLPADQFNYQLLATLVDGSKVTLAAGNLSVMGPPGMTPLYPPAV